MRRGAGVRVRNVPGCGKGRSKDLEIKEERKEVKTVAFLAQSRPFQTSVTQRTHNEPTSGCSALRDLIPKEAAEMM